MTFNILEVGGMIMNHSDDFLIILQESDELFCNMM